MSLSISAVNNGHCQLGVGSRVVNCIAASEEYFGSWTVTIPRNLLCLVRRP